MNSTTENTVQDYKGCAGKDCQRAGINYLKVLYLNRKGWFCDSCKASLVADRLVIEEDSSNRLEVDY
jgi:hypothetical protein